LYLSGVLYLALIPSYTVSAVEYGFDGYIVGDDNSLVIVNYRNSQTSTVLNPEINNSLTILTTQRQIIRGNNFSNFFGSLLGLSSLNLPLSGGTLNGTLNGTVATFHQFNKCRFSQNLVICSLTIKRISFEIKNVNEISSLSYDRTNSLYKPLIIDGSNITLKIQW
jgi:hypothetical protein